MTAPPSEEGSVWLTPAAYAKKYDVDARTVRRWARDGRVTATRTPGNQWRIQFPPVAATTTTEGQP